MSYELQLIDTNCNDCVYFKRDLVKTFDNNKNPLIKRNKIHYGVCELKNKEVSTIANICTPENVECFKHRKDE